MLLARVSPSDQTTTTPWRGMFSRDDAWLPTGDLFRRDGDGDYWRVDSVGDVIRTAAGPVFTARIRDALGDLPAVDLAVAYGVGSDGGAEQIAIAAITLRGGGELAAQELTRAMEVLPLAERPAIVHVVEEIPVTTWYRPLTGPLREAGIPEPGGGLPVWFIDPSSGRYKPFTEAAHRKLAGQTA
jgi:putative long chain acyl-CoA synthase